MQPPQAPPPVYPLFPPIGAPPYGAYPNPAFAPYGAPPQEHPSAKPALILGVLSWTFGGIIAAIAAWIVGRKALRQIRAEPYRYTGESDAKIGMWLGIAHVLFMAVVVVVVVIAVVVAETRPRPQGPSAPNALTQSFTTSGGHLTLHYPSTFVAKTLGERSAMVWMNDAHRTDTAWFIVVDEPSSNDLHEFARVTNLSSVSELKDYVQGETRDTECNGTPAVAVDGTYTSTRKVGPATVHACAFFHDGHGYYFAYLGADEDLAKGESLLKKILEATDIHPVHAASKPSDVAKQPKPDDETLAESFHLGHVTAHYPSSFVADTHGTNLLTLERSDADHFESIWIVVDEHPISTIPGELARHQHAYSTGRLREWRDTSTKGATCAVAKNVGIALTGTYSAATSGRPATLRACAFLRDGVGYYVAYLAPNDDLAQHEALLQKIVDGLEVN